MKLNNESNNSHRFGAQQMRIMRLLWESPMSAREITGRLNEEEKEAPVAHSTVQTLLRQLEGKKAVQHRAEERVFVYCPLIQKENAIEKATHDFVEKIFGGSIPSLVSYLIKDESISPNEFKKIEQLILKRGGKS